MTATTEPGELQRRPHPQPITGRTSTIPIPTTLSATGTPSTFSAPTRCTNFLSEEASGSAMTCLQWQTRLPATGQSTRLFRSTPVSHLLSTRLMPLELTPLPPVRTATDLSIIQRMLALRVYSFLTPAHSLNLPRVRSAIALPKDR